MSFYRRLINTASFKYALIFSLLTTIVIMLGLASVYIKSYQLLEKQVNLRLVTELANQQLFDGKSTEKIADDIVVLNIDVKNLPADFPNKKSVEPFSLSKKQLKHYGLLQGKAIEKLAVIAQFSTDKLWLVGITLDSNELLYSMNKAIFYLFVAILFIMILFSSLISVQMMRRIDYIDITAQEIMKGELKKRIPVNPARRDEITALSKTLNTMLDTINRLMQDVKQVNNNIAHDLRSPLNRLRSRMDISLLNKRTTNEYQTVIEDSIIDLDGILQTFNSLLLIANLESGSRDYDFKTLSLSELLSDLAELYAVLCEEKSHAFDSLVEDNIHVYGNKNLLAQGVSNLMDNAIKYTPAGGEMKLTLIKKNNHAMITITDNGVGIPQDKFKLVFERFTRLDASRSLPGTGLGMSLVQSIMKIHQANIELNDNQPGLKVSIRMPCS